MHFKYIGDKKEMKNVYGYDFSGGEAVEIPESDTLACNKLSGNSHFEKVKKRRPSVPKQTSEETIIEEDKAE